MIYPPLLGKNPPAPPPPQKKRDDFYNTQYSNCLFHLVSQTTEKSCVNSAANFAVIVSRPIDEVVQYYASSIIFRFSFYHKPLRRAEETELQTSNFAVIVSRPIDEVVPYFMFNLGYFIIYFMCVISW